MKILIRLPNWIGDAVMATPTIRVILEKAGGVFHGVWGPDRIVSLFENFPGINQLHRLDEKGNTHSFDTIRQVGYDRIYLLTNSFSSAKSAKELGIRERIGYRTDWRGWFLTKKVWCSPRVKNLPMVHYYLHLLPPEWRETATFKPLLFLSEEEIRNAAALLKDQFGENPKNLVGMAPGAAFGTAKQWFPERFAEIAFKLTRKGIPVIILGSDQETGLGENILAGVPSHLKINLAGKTTLREMLAMIHACSLVLVHDSGPMHLADAVGTPVVALFGSTDSSWTGPQLGHHQVIQADVACTPCFLRECPLGRECMKSISVSDVSGAIEAILKQKNLNHHCD